MTASPSRSTAPARPARVLLLMAGLAVAAVGLVACVPDAGSPDPTTPAASDTPGTPGQDDSPEPTPTATGASNGGGLAADLADAMGSGDTAAIEDYLTEPTRVVIAASEADMQYSAVDAVLALDYVHPGVGVWDFDLASDVVDSYAANPYYGEFFPDAAIVGRSDAGAVVSFVPNGDRVGTIFMSMHESLITDY